MHDRASHRRPAPRPPPPVTPAGHRHHLAVGEPDREVDGPRSARGRRRRHAAAHREPGCPRQGDARMPHGADDVDRDRPELVVRRASARGRR